MKYTQGGFDYETLKNMPIGEYNALKYAVNKLVFEEEQAMEEAKEDAKDKAKGIGMPTKKR